MVMKRGPRSSFGRVYRDCYGDYNQGHNRSDPRMSPALITTSIRSQILTLTLRGNGMYVHLCLCNYDNPEDEKSSMPTLSNLNSHTSFSEAPTELLSNLVAPKFPGG